MNLIKTLTISYYIGMALIVIGILFQLNDVEYAAYILALGLIPFLGVRLYNMLNGKFENRRLHSILVVSALALLAATIGIFLNKGYWIIGVLITATLDLYVSFRKFTR
ncbi:hypothetical protein [Saccharicrinis aurantiacus]|uniref:hypothetical protein n=1 Tax=Saccharicrinis aurantiacus TaxID=1849719 RepID=UPI00094F8304|nr:hypothetical protein [Saccharicrinis aurantiacus]